jgi:integrase
MRENKISSIGNKSYIDSGYLFTGKYGNPLGLVETNVCLSKLTSTNKKVTTHTFRHAHITMLCEQGLSLKAIMERVGHNSPAITMKIYAHVTSKMEKEVVEKLDKIQIS